MKNRRYSEFILGIIILILGLFYFLLTSRLGVKSTIDSRFVPYVLSGFLFLLSVFQIARGIKLIRDDALEYGEEKIDYSTLIKTLTLIVLYIGFLNILGFILATIIFLFLEFVVLSPKETKKNYVLYSLIALSTSFIVYFLFSNGLNLILPKGLLKLGGI